MKLGRWVWFILSWASVSLGAETPSEQQLRLLFVGDIMGHASQIAAATVKKDTTFDYAPNFYSVSPLLKSVDIAIGNLEVTLPGKPPYTGFPMFRSPDALAYALKDAGFKVLVTANNHSNDSGPEGVLHTIEAVQKAGLLQTGTFSNEESREKETPLILTEKGFRVALLNYSYGTNGIPTKLPAVVNVFDDTRIQADLKKTVELKPDFILVMVHWGSEYQLEENETQKQWAKKLLEWGADAVVGSHPHVVQPIRELTFERADGTKQTAIVAYSLGNFISAQDKEHTDVGIAFEMTLAKKTTDNRARLVSHAYTPVLRYIHATSEKKRQFYALPASLLNRPESLPVEISESALIQMRNTAEALRKRLSTSAAKKKPDVGVTPAPTTQQVERER